MCGEILTIETIKKIAKLQRLERDKNLLEKKIEFDKFKIVELEEEIKYLKERNKTLEAIEKSLPQRIETYKSKNAPFPVIKELEFWESMLKEEKEKLIKRCENEKI